MRRSLHLNLALLALALASFMVVVLALSSPARTSHADETARARSVVDATGARLRVARYARIASGSLIADRLLLELVEPERVCAYSPYTPADAPFAHRMGRVARLDPRGDLERIVSLRPDLLLVNEFIDPARVERLRRGGLVVADLGPMRGLATLRANIELLATLVDELERGRALLARFERRVRLLRARRDGEPKKSGLYLGIHGSQIYGGASNTSFHDIIELAGLTDAAAEYVDWPSYSSEQVLALDPDVLVTQQGRGDALCRHAGFAALRACRDGAVVEIDEALINDPGLVMLEAAEVLHEAVYAREAAP